MRNLYIDFDGVILDTIPMLYDLLETSNIDKYNKEEVTKFYETVDWEKLLENTEQINDSIICIQKLINSNKFDIAILTHVNSLKEAVEKVKFIRRYFFDITVIPVPKMISKTEMVHTKDAILVDDYSVNLVEWQNASGIGIRFNKELESKGFKVINRLDQLLTMEF